MNRRLLDLLVCPLDRTRLELIEWESHPVELPAEAAARARDLGIEPAALGRVVTTGVLVNRARRIFYPIHNGVPRMLVFPTAVAQEFVTRHSARLAQELPGYGPPQEAPQPGEGDVLRTFSSEWVNYDWDSRSYWDRPADEMYRAMDFMLDFNRRPARGKLVLEVGIGIGGIADNIVRTQGCELVGIDLSHAVDAAHQHFGNNPLLHIVQASLFRPPFRDASFDLVFSHGVIHHTFSTATAFQTVCRLPKVGGRLYVWVYSPTQESRTLLRRMLMGLETLVRPAISSLPEGLQTVALLPAICAYIVHQRLLVNGVRRSSNKYGWREAVHAARDRLTPPFAHRHTDDEVTGWFRAAGYTDLQCVSRRERPSFVPVHFASCTGVDGIRQAAPPAAL